MERTFEYSNETAKSSTSCSFFFDQQINGIGRQHSRCYETSEGDFQKKVN